MYRFLLRILALFLDHREDIVIAVAAALIVLRVVVYFFDLEPEQEGTNYPEPKLALEPDGPHDVFGELQSTLVVDAAADERYLARHQESSSPVTPKLMVVGATLAALVALPYALPENIAGKARLLTPQKKDVDPAGDHAIAAGGPMPAASVGEARLPGETTDQQNRANELEAANDARGPIAAKKKLPPKFAPPKSEKKPPRPIDDPSKKALHKFFEKLARVESKEPGQTARILYFGDSIVASDFVTGKLRRRMQTRFGDAGHGYAIMANAWPGWFHIDVSRKASADWRVSTCVGPYAKDELYGLGCASFHGQNRGAWAEFATAHLDKWGRKVSRFELEYLEQPGGGTVELSIDGKLIETVDTAGPEKKLAYKSITVPDGKHKLRVQCAENKPIRLFGIRMERDVPGVTLSAMGITGARARFLDKQDDDHLRQTLQASKADLVVLAFGSNEITDGTMYPMDKYRETLEAVMVQFEKALPNASLMLAGPPDMASKNPAWGYSRPTVSMITKNQKELAAKRGWAFWDQYRAMGGGGSMWAWVQAGLGSTDMFHPTGQGGNILGNYEYLALMESFEAYKASHSK